MRTIQWQQYNVAVYTPQSLLLVGILAVLILAVQRRYVSIILVAGLCYIPYVQRIMLGDLDLDMIRILILATVARYAIRSEKLIRRFVPMDGAVIGYILVETLATLARSGFSVGAIVNRAGTTFTVLGVYLAMRFSLRDTTDVREFIKGILLLAVPIALAMSIEQAMEYNVFASLGGVSPDVTIRDGRIRSTAAFPHPILAGAFGASLLPFAWLASRDNSFPRIIAPVGLACSALIVLTSASSGPVMSLGAATLGILIWRWRCHMRGYQIAALWGLVGLHFVMEAPVWALVMRVGAVSGSTGYHRYFLIDQAIRRFREWWLWGVESTAYWGWGLQDVTNMYVRVGIDGGIVALLLFVIAIVSGFRALRSARESADIARRDEILAWALSVHLATHLVSFIGVSYFSNTIVLFLAALASAVAVSPTRIELCAERAREARGGKANTTMVRLGMG